MPFSEWSIDICLTCEGEAPHGAAYCSQACRLADMERSSCSSSPKTAASAGSSGAPGGFYLPPAFNFSSVVTKPSSSSSPSPTRTTPSWPSSSHQSSGRKSSSPIGLHTSPSRTSLSSVPSQHSPFEQAYLSEKSLRELNDYANCFDQVRDYKRRMTVV